MKLEWTSLERVLENFIINDAQRPDERGFIVGATRDGVMELCEVLSAVFDPEKAYPEKPLDTARSDINFLKPRVTISEANHQLIQDALGSKDAAAFGKRMMERWAKGAE